VIPCCMLPVCTSLSAHAMYHCGIY
jgi:hypothetical protein